MSSIVFVDRDGVLNACRRGPEGEPLPPRSVSEFCLLPGVMEACTQLKKQGYRLVVVTNQPDVARRTQSRDTVEAIHTRLTAMLPIDAISVCWHDDSDGCSCRKPKPGLLEDAAHNQGVILEHCFMVGDRWRDIEAGKRAGCRTALVGGGYGEPFLSEPDYRAEDLLGAAVWITSGQPLLTRQNDTQGEQ